jgi:hypothetical protein
LTQSGYPYHGCPGFKNIVMLKYISFFLFLFGVQYLNAQTIRFSYGFDLFYFPDFTPKFTQYSESYKIQTSFKIHPKLSINASYRFAGIAGNYPIVLDDYPNISNTDPGQEKYIEYEEFNPGVYAIGNKGVHWGEFINILGLDIETNLLNYKDKFWIEASIGAKLEFGKGNSIRAVVGDHTHGGILTTPEGKEVLVQFQTYEVITSATYIFSSSLSVNRKLSNNSHIYLGTDFNYLIPGAAYWFLDLGIGYQF